MLNQKIFEFYTDGTKSKYSSNPKDILNLICKKVYEKLCTKETSIADNFLAKFLTERKYLMITLIIMRRKYL